VYQQISNLNMKNKLVIIVVILNMFEMYSQHNVYQVHNVSENRWSLTDTSFNTVINTINKSSDSTIFLIRLIVLDTLILSGIDYNIDYECFKEKKHLIGDFLLERPFINLNSSAHFNIPDGFWLRLIKTKHGIDTLSTFYVLDSLLELKFVENGFLIDGRKFKEVISFHNGKLDGFSFFLINDAVTNMVFYRKNITEIGITFENNYTNETLNISFNNFMPDNGKVSESYNFGTILRYIDFDNNFEIIGDKNGFFTIEKW